MLDAVHNGTQMKKMVSRGSLEAMKRKWSILNPANHIDGEKWKTILEFPTYEVSNHGRVRNISMGNLLKGRSLNGYVQICIKWEGKLYFRYVHILVLTYFSGPCPIGYESRHLDGIRSHNILNNLVWGTHDENMKDKIKHHQERKSKNYQFKLLIAPFILFFFLFIQPCQAYDLFKLDFDKWSQRDYYLEGTWVIIHAFDWGTTLDIANNSHKYYELNPILGKHPSRNKIHLYMGLGTLLHIGAIHIMPKSWRPYFQYITIGMSGWCVANNFSLGLRIAL